MRARTTAFPPAERERGTALLKLAALVLYAFPGSPTVYYGDEAGMEGFEDPFNRRTYPWGARGYRAARLVPHARQAPRRTGVAAKAAASPILLLRAACSALPAARAMRSPFAPSTPARESASVDLPWAAPLAHDALSGQSFLAEGGRLHITLAPYDALLLTE